MYPPQQPYHQMPSPYQQPPRKSSSGVIAIAILAVIVGIGIFLYFYFEKNQNTL